MNRFFLVVMEVDKNQNFQASSHQTGDVPAEHCSVTPPNPAHVRAPQEGSQPLQDSQSTFLVHTKKEQACKGHAAFSI